MSRLQSGRYIVMKNSGDTIGRAIKELATDNINYTAKSSGKSYAFNTNPKLNGLLLESAIWVGLLKRGQMVDVDFDHVFTPCDKADHLPFRHSAGKMDKNGKDMGAQTLYS